MGKDKTGGMGKLAAKTKAETDELLSEREAEVLKNTTVDLESLRPQVSDKEAFEQLVKAVEESTKKNESIAALQERLTQLGSAVVNTAKLVITKIPSV